MNILFLAAEVAPYAKVGGLADVAGALPKALRALGHDTRVIMPRYGRIDGGRYNLRLLFEPFTYQVGHETFVFEVLEGSMEGVPIYFVDVYDMFGNRSAVYGEDDDGRRFLLFCTAALATVGRLDWRPDIINANDWHTAIVPPMLRSGKMGPFFDGVASVFTIHNLAYQGIISYSGLGGVAAVMPNHIRDEWVNVMALGLLDADALNTVSPNYAREILTPEYGADMDGLLRSRRERLFGILNGIDTDVFDPATDPAIAANYSVDDPSAKAQCKIALQQEANFPTDSWRPVMGMIGRLVDQKGFDLFAGGIEQLLQESPLQVVILGTGDPRYHDLLHTFERYYPGRIRAWLTFDAALAQRIYSGADMFLMPSRFEPCGLGQMIAMRYGTVPIVRGTGGLADTVHEGPPGDPRTGFVFWEYQVGQLQHAVRRAIDTFWRQDEWQQIVRNDMRLDNSWQRSARAYVDLYRYAMALHYS